MNDHQPRLAPRYDFYRYIHKALRMTLGELLTRIGCLDADDVEGVAALLRDVRDQLELSGVHLMHEDAVIHPILAEHAPTVVAELDRGHDGHRAALFRLQDALNEAAAAPAGAVEQPLHALYLAFTQYMAQDLAHMAYEELVVMPLLQSLFDDDALRAMDRRIIDGQPAEVALATGKAIMRAARPGERLALAEGTRATLPPPAFERLIAAIAPALTPADAARLYADLGIAA